MEVGFVYYDIQDQCEFLDGLNGWVTALDFEAQGKPEFCGYSPSELAKQLPSEVEFNEVIEQTSISQMMGGRSIRCIQQLRVGVRLIVTR